MDKVHILSIRKSVAMPLCSALIAFVYFYCAAQLAAEDYQDSSDDRTTLAVTHPSSGWKIPWGTSSSQPTIYRGRVFAGTNLDPLYRGGSPDDVGCMVCVDLKSGTLQWRYSHPKLRNRNNDLPGLGIQSRPVCFENRVYYLSNNGELVCLDVDGFHDSENDGDFKSESFTGELDGDVVWKISLIEELGIHKRDMGDIGNPVSSPVIVNGFVFVMTGHGVNTIGAAPNDQAPSFVAVDAENGTIAWRSSDPNNGLMYGQWASPIEITLPGRSREVVFPAGDGCLYGVNADSFQNTWKLDCNSEIATSWTKGKRGSRLFFASSPVLVGGKLICALTHEFENAEEHSELVEINLQSLMSPSNRNLISWRYSERQIAGGFGQITTDDQAIYGVANDGVLRAIDLKSGKLLWELLIGDGIPYGRGPFIYNGKIVVTSYEEVCIVQPGLHPKIVERHELFGITNSPAVIDGMLIVPTCDFLHAIRVN